MVPVEYKGCAAHSRVSGKVCSSAPSPNGKAEVGRASIPGSNPGGASKMSVVNRRISNETHDVGST